MVLSTEPSKVNQAQTETVESWMERLRELYAKDTNRKISGMKTRQGVSCAS